eukprot:scaffold96770_cov36-Tisochrysis_lutea.AAC.1
MTLSVLLVLIIVPFITGPAQAAEAPEQKRSQAAAEFFVGQIRLGCGQDDLLVVGVAGPAGVGARPPRRRRTSRAARRPGAPPPSPS